MSTTQHSYIIFETNTTHPTLNSFSVLNFFRWKYISLMSENPIFFNWCLRCKAFCHVFSSYHYTYVAIMYWIACRKNKVSLVFSLEMCSQTTLNSFIFSE